MNSNFFTKITDNKTKRTVLIAAALVFVIILCTAISLTSSKTENTSQSELFIYPDDNFEKVKAKLVGQRVISKSNTSFSAFAKTLKYTDNIKAGHYLIKPKTSVLTLVRNLRAGNQQPVRLVVLNARTSEDFAEKVSQKLMITSDDILKEIRKQGFEYGNEIFEYIIPNTYEVFWNISADKLLDKLRKESDKFWENNKEKLKMTGFSRKEVVILASIVSQETNKEDEMPRIAGVYINRLNKDMLLQADPTVKFAVGDFSLRRILGKHLQTDSPFNTYKYKGLPPAPICLPSVAALKSVLKYEKHNYIFFCAKEDFSGYHNFAVTAEEHIQNANRYRKVLNQKGI